MKTMHYLWVGPPTKMDPFAIAGHDVAGPIQMAQQLQKQKKDGDIFTPRIKFWCLKEHEEFYRNQFKTHEAEIEVCSIEGLLETESKGELSESSEFVSRFMKEKLNPSKGSIVKFKDLFSLFLLLSQDGYFFDTNVFPIKGRDVKLRTGFQAATAISPDGLNDFYLMYSPTRNNPNIRKVFKNWIANPGFGYVKAFKDCNLSVMNANSIESMGIKKFSYKSYFPCPDAARGLFFWIGVQPGLAEYLKYGDMNQKIDNDPSSITLVEKCNLCAVRGPLTETLLELNVNTNEAYVFVISDDKQELFYVNKAKKICERFENAKAHEYLSLFPEDGGTKAATDTDIAILNGDYQRKNFKNYRHSMIANTKNQTLMHQAVMKKDFDSVHLLIDCGADCNLKATYQIHPDGTTLELTPLELAKYLKLEEISNLFKPEAIELGIKKREIDNLIDDFSNKISAIKLHPSHRAQKKATELLASLRVAQERYNAVQSTASEDTRKQADKQFKTDCRAAIKDAKPILENDLEWGDYLSNLLKNLLNLVMGKFFSDPKGHVFFQTLRPESAEAAENLEQNLNDPKFGS